MAITITWNGYGKVTDADSTTGWAVIKATAGGGTPSVALADGGLQAATGSAQAITTTSNNKRILLYYDLGSGNELDFTPTTGSEAGELVYVWGSFLAPGLLQTQATGGLGIMLGTDNAGTVEWSLYYFYGSDNYTGGWKRMVVDPAFAQPSVHGSGTTNNTGSGVTISSVRYLGVFGDTNNTARFDNLLVDRIDVGNGYTVTGTTTSAGLFADILAAEETTANYWGIVNRLNDSGSALELNGELTLGDNVGTGATTLTDENSKVFLAQPEYYQGTGTTNPVDLDYAGIRQVGNATGATSVTMGVKVGTGDSASGRNGISIVGNDQYEMFIDFDDGNVNTSKWYGCSFEKVGGVIDNGTNTAHEFIGNSLTECSQFDPGSIEVRACNFVAVQPETAANSAALLWNANADVRACSFIANNDPATGFIAHGIEFPNPSTGIDIIDLTFSGNEKGVWFSSSTGNLVLDASGVTNLGATDYTNSSTGTVTVNNNKSVTFTGLKDNSEVRVYNASTGAQIAGIEDATTGTPDNRTFTWSAAAGTVVDYVIHNWQPGVVTYESIRVNDYTVPTSDTSIAVQQRVDRNAS